MAIFVATLNNSSGSFSATANGTIISIKDYSNYDTNTESGHTQNDFSDLRIIKYILPDSSTYTISSLGTGDQITIPAKNAILPIQDIWNNYTGGDGVWQAILYTVPTFNASAPYLFLSAHHIYYNGDVYKCINDTIGNLPTDPHYFTKITNLDDLPSKYRFSQKFSVECDSQICYINKLKQALCEGKEIGCDLEKLMFNRDYLIANKMLLILSSLNYLVSSQDWNSVKNDINHLRSICCCNK